MNKNVDVIFWRLAVFYLFWMILLFGRACLFTSDMDPRTNTLGYVITYGIPLLLLEKYKININDNVKIIVLIFSFWTMCHLLSDRVLKLLPYINSVLNLMSAYVIVRIFKNKLFVYFYKIVSYLTLLDVSLWIFINVVGVRHVARYSMLVPTSGASSASFFIFNTPNCTAYEGLGLWGMVRNCGFCWEPGLFASILVLAIFFNLMVNNYKWKNNLHLLILLIGLFSTFSTTGYIAFLVMILCRYYFLMRKGHTLSSVLFLVLILPLLLVVMDLPFMENKIIRDSDKGNFAINNVEAMNYVEKTGAIFVPGRSEGIFLDFQNFIHDPIDGYGLAVENSWVYNNISTYIRISNGVIQIFSRFGVILALLFHFAFIRSSRQIRKINKGENSLYVIFMILSVSYDLYLLSLCFALIFYSQFVSSSKRKIYSFPK